MIRLALEELSRLHHASDFFFPGALHLLGGAQPKQLFLSLFFSSVYPVGRVGTLYLAHPDRQAHIPSSLLLSLKALMPYYPQPMNAATSYLMAPYPNFVDFGGVLAV